MMLLPLFIATRLVLARALPSEPASRSQLYIPCTNNLYDNAYCCSYSILGDYVDCEYPLLPISASDFQNQCAWTGKTALCCVRPLIGFGVVFCETPSGLRPFGDK